MVKKVTLYMPTGAQKVFDSTAYKITTDGDKVIVRSASGERQEFVGIPFEAEYEKPSPSRPAGIVVSTGRKRPIHFR